MPWHGSPTSDLVEGKIFTPILAKRGPDLFSLSLHQMPDKPYKFSRKTENLIANLRGIPEDQALSHMRLGFSAAFWTGSWIDTESVKIHPRIVFAILGHPSSVKRMLAIVLPKK